MLDRDSGILDSILDSAIDLLVYLGQIILPLSPLPPFACLGQLFGAGSISHYVAVRHLPRWYPDLGWYLYCNTDIKQ